jgi:hypothetical protein
MGLSGIQSVQQVVQLFLVGRGDGVHGTTMSARGTFTSTFSSGVKSSFVEDFTELVVLAVRTGKQRVESSFERISVLVNPFVGIVVDDTGVVSKTKHVVVGFLIALELRVTAIELLDDLGGEFTRWHIIDLPIRFVDDTRTSSDTLFLGDTDFFERSEDVVDQGDGHGTILVNNHLGPWDFFTSVFFLFEGEHVVVEELLETFVGKVNADLFERVLLEDFETGNI